MTQADILAMTYDDLLVIRRSREVEHDGETKREYVVIAEGMLCALSKKIDGKHTQSTPQASVKTDTALFCYPHLDIVKGDLVAVQIGGRHNTKSTRYETYIAGEPFSYSSHLEVPLTRECEV